MKRSTPVMVHCLYVSSTVKQEASYLEITTKASIMKRGRPFIVHCSSIRSMV
jgi:hypothetical protein